VDGTVFGGSFDSRAATTPAVPRPVAMLVMASIVDRASNTLRYRAAWD
jgi:hypothetical protein